MARVTSFSAPGVIDLERSGDDVIFPPGTSFTDSEIAAALRDGSIEASEALAQMVEDGRV